jgi:hypothetical protein
MYNNPHHISDKGFEAKFVPQEMNFRPDDKFLSNLRLLEASSILSGVPFSLEMAFNSMLE